jgi:hypothetical protein
VFWQRQSRDKPSFRLLIVIDLIKTPLEVYCEADCYGAGLDDPVVQFENSRCPGTAERPLHID